MDLSKLTILAERSHDAEWLKRVTTCTVQLRVSNKKSGTKLSYLIIILSF